jgi:hypothetical protein
MKITTDELRFIFDSVIKKLKIEGYRELEIEDDFYCLISTEKWSDMSILDDIHCDVGSLQDDLRELKKIPEKETVTFVDFDRLAAILRMISQLAMPIES